MQGRESGPGYLTSLGTEPPLYFNGTLRHRLSQPRQNVFARGGGQQTSNAQLSKGPAKSELDPMRVRSLGHARPQTAPLFTADIRL